MEKVKQTSSTGSNFVNFDKELEDDATSNSINQQKFQPKAESVGYIFKFSDEKSDKQQRDENNLMIAQIGPYDSTAESALQNEMKYTPKTIYEELVKLGLDQYMFFKAYDLLVHNTKESVLFCGLPPKFRRNWVLRSIFPKRKCLEEIDDIPYKKRKLN